MLVVAPLVFSILGILANDRNQSSIIPDNQCSGYGSGVGSDTFCRISSGSETFCRIRIQSQIRNKSFRIRIRAALTRNEFETKLL